MSRQSIISQVTAQLSRMGVPFQAGQGADLTVFNDFVDASWSTGAKRIVYEASVFADEVSSTVFMWEKTTETGNGISGGFGGGSFTQSGTTLFRKVKCVQYGPDGKVFEYNLDLGAIPKSVKEAAKQAGWKFKTVLSKGKAQYPAGYQPAAASSAAPAVPVYTAPMTPTPGGSFCARCGQPLSAGAQFCASCGQPAAAPLMPAAPILPPQPVSAPGYAPAAGKPKDAFKTLTIIAYALTALLVFGIYALLKVSLLGWLIGLPVFILSAALQLSVVKKGCVTGFVVWFLTTAVLLGVSLFNY